jgi:hypothetical protein
MVFWDVTPFSIVKGYQQFRGTCYLHTGDVTLEVERKCNSAGGDARFP